MEIKHVSEILSHNGLNEPRLNALVPNEDNYKVLLLQPFGQIEVSTDFVRNRDQELAGRQFGRFLNSASEIQADLVVTPEYSMPWNVLKEAIQLGLVPAQGKVWALGCESIKYNELEELKQELAPLTTVLFETLISEATKFVSPIVYVFRTTHKGVDSEERTVVLVQFKTHPMGDPNHFEISGLQRGTTVYQFGGGEQYLKLVSLVCADAFAFDDAHAKFIHDRALILHIQLNQEPRHMKFIGCRQRLLCFNGDSTEVLCLNWARDAHLHRGITEVKWKNIAGSAWYLKSKDFDKRDATQCVNHRKGFYYTYLHSLRSHAMFFNYEPATYLLEATKVAHVGVMGAISKRRGPQLLMTRKWDDGAGDWLEQITSNDGFHAIVEKSGEASEAIKNIADGNPFEAERIMALIAGKVESGFNWHDISNLDSCMIESSEIINRITFCQDTHQSASDFRIARLKRLKRLWQILHTEELPPALKDLFIGGFNLNWSQDFPHQNVISADGQRATLVYMGEDSDVTQVEATKKKIADYLFRTATDADQRISAKQRLAVWFRGENNKFELFDPHEYVQYDQTGEAPVFDIGREA